jgi:hypothetical protein
MKWQLIRNWDEGKKRRCKTLKDRKKVERIGIKHR